MLGRAGRVAKGGGSGEHDDVNVRQTNRHAAPALRRQDADPLLCTNRQSCSSLHKWVTDTPSLGWKVGTQEGGAKPRSQISMRGARETAPWLLCKNTVERREEHRQINN